MTKTIRVNNMIHGWVREQDNFNQYITKLIVEDMKSNDRGFAMVKLHGAICDAQDLLNEFQLIDDLTGEDVSFDDDVTELLSVHGELFNMHRRVSLNKMDNETMEDVMEYIEEARTILDKYIK